MRGRKPKPTELKIAQGNPGKQSKAILSRGLKIPNAIPDPPADLSELAADEWRRIAPLLHDIGMLAKIDRDALALYCESLADWFKARREVLAKPMIGKRRNPQWVIEEKAAARLLRMMAEFGLTPSSRMRLNQPAGTKPKDEFDSFVSQAG